MRLGHPDKNCGESMRAIRWAASLALLVLLAAAGCGGGSAGSRQDNSGATANSSVVTVITPDGPQVVANESGPDVLRDGVAQQDPGSYEAAYEYCSRWPSQFTVDEQRSIIALGRAYLAQYPNDGIRLTIADNIVAGLLTEMDPTSSYHAGAVEGVGCFDAIDHYPDRTGTLPTPSSDGPAAAPTPLITPTPTFPSDQGTTPALTTPSSSPTVQSPPPSHSSSSGNSGGTGNALVPATTPSTPPAAKPTPQPGTSSGSGGPGAPLP